MEPGESPTDCALRETMEELAIPPSEIQILGRGDFICNQRGFLLRPVLGLVSAAGIAALHPAPAEVAVYSYELIPSVPKDFPYETVGIPRSYPWDHGRVEVPVWTYNGHAVWGMTARLVRDIVSTL